MLIIVRTCFTSVHLTRIVICFCFSVLLHNNSRKSEEPITHKKKERYNPEKDRKNKHPNDYKKRDDESKDKCVNEQL